MPPRVVPESCCIPATKDACTDAKRTDPDKNPEVLFSSVSSLCSVHLHAREGLKIVVIWWIMASFIYKDKLVNVICGLGHS